MKNYFLNNPKGNYFVALWIMFIGFDISAQPFAIGHKGNIDGVKVWQLPDAPDGTHPTQCWHAIGSTPNGDIYISGHDHTNNTMLYKLDILTDTLKWVGDAATASKAANNWEDGEVAEKFHTRPIEYNGNMYVATLSHSELNDGYLNTRGFHWYKYSIKQDTFIDLSADEIGGVGAAHLQVVTIQVDKKNNVLYGATIPECKIVKYDIDKGQTEVLGTPWGNLWNDYLYSNRVMWVDSRGRLYISAGSDNKDINNRYNGEPESVFNHIWYYDFEDDSFGELPEFQLQSPNAIEMGQWNLNHTKFYMSDDRGRIYCFEDEGAKWKYLGRPSEEFAYAWVMNVSADEKKIYIGDNHLWRDQPIYEFDIETGTSEKICTISQVDNSIGEQDFMTGYDSWDNNGNFYVANFSQPNDDNVHFIRINPVRMKVAKGLLPSLVTVGLDAPENDFIVSFDGSTENKLEVIYKAVGKRNGEIIFTTYLNKTIYSRYKDSEIITIEDLAIPDSVNIDTVSVTVLPDGNDYIVNKDAITISLPADKITKYIDLPPNKVDELEANIKVTVFPNPFNGFLNVRADNQISHIAIYSVTGKLVYSKAIVNTECNLRLSDLLPGMYFIHIKTASAHKVCKIIKN